MLTSVPKALVKESKNRKFLLKNTKFNTLVTLNAILLNKNFLLLIPESLP